MIHARPRIARYERGVFALANRVASALAAINEGRAEAVHMPNTASWSYRMGSCMSEPLLSQLRPMRTSVSAMQGPRMQDGAATRAGHGARQLQPIRL